MKASERITSHINDLADWRGKMLARLRKLIHDAAPDLEYACVVAERKRGSRGSLPEPGQGQLLQGRVAGRSPASL